MHQTGASNRPIGWNKIDPVKDGPTDFDKTMRSTMPREFKYGVPGSVPIATTGGPNQDFQNTIPGAEYWNTELPYALKKLKEKHDAEALMQTHGSINSFAGKGYEYNMLGDTQTYKLA